MEKLNPGFKAVLTEGVNLNMLYQSTPDEYKKMADVILSNHK
jgi:hypothetical protein